MTMQLLSTSGNELWLALGWALLHSVWQIALVALGYWVLRGLVRSPRVRYAAGLACLAAALALPAATALEALRDDGTSTRLLEIGAAAPWGDTAAPTEVEMGSLTEGRAPIFDARGVAIWAARLWLVGVAALLVRLAAGAWWLRRLVRREAIEVQPAPIELVQRLAARIGVCPTPGVVLSERIDVPCVVGALRPALLLPLSTLSGLPPAQLEAVLLHELAHIRRHDVMVNWLQTVVETLLFYHPAVHWLSREVRQEREHCCDDLVVATTREPAEYARALARLERLRAAPALAAAAGAGNLRGRIERLLDRSARAERASLAVPAAVAGVLVLAVSVLAAAAPEQEAKAPQALVKIETRIFELDRATLDRLTVRWERLPGTPATLRYGTAEVTTLEAELAQAEVRILSAPVIKTLTGESAEIRSGMQDPETGEPRELSLGMRPELQAGESLDIDLAFEMGPPGDAAAAAADRVELRVEELPFEPGRAVLLAERGNEAGEVVAVALFAELTPVLDASTVDRTIWSGASVTLSLNEAQLEEVVASFEHEFEMQVRVDGIRGTRAELFELPVSVEMNAVPWDFALQFLLNRNCFDVEREGSVWTVRPGQPTGTIAGTPRPCAGPAPRY